MQTSSEVLSASEEGDVYIALSLQTPTQKLQFVFLTPPPYFIIRIYPRGLPKKVLLSVGRQQTTALLGREHRCTHTDTEPFAIKHRLHHTGRWHEEEGFFFPAW